MEVQLDESGEGMGDLNGSMEIRTYPRNLQLMRLEKHSIRLGACAVNCLRCVGFKNGSGGDHAE